MTRRDHATWACVCHGVATWRDASDRARCRQGRVRKYGRTHSSSPLDVARPRCMMIGDTRVTHRDHAMWACVRHERCDAARNEPIRRGADGGGRAESAVARTSSLALDVPGPRTAGGLSLDDNLSAPSPEPPPPQDARCALLARCTVARDVFPLTEERNTHGPNTGARSSVSETEQFTCVTTALRRVR